MAKTAPLLWFDGALIPASGVAVPVMSHALQRGSLVFDVGSFHAGARGTCLFRAREHAQRFLRSAKIVGLDLGYGEDALVEAALDVVRACGASEGLVRWAAFFDAPEPDLVPRSAAAHVVVAAQLLEDPPRESPLRVAVFDDARKAAPEALSPEAKVAAAYVGPMLARRRAKAAGADEVVLLDRDGMIAEAPIGNVFAVVSGALWTPPLRYVLAGITRDSILAIARDEGLAVREEPLSLDAFASADEAFVTSTSSPLSAIGWVNERALAAPNGPITRRLSQILGEAQRGAVEPYTGWVRWLLPT